MGKALLVLRTVRHLKPVQVWNRIWRGRLRSKVEVDDGGASSPLPEFTFLNVKGAPNGWNDPKFEKLWLYNLHYFDFIHCQPHDPTLTSSSSTSNLNLICRWIEENPQGWGNGWEPYPISLRVVNWVKWLMRTRAKSEDCGLRKRAEECVEKWLSGVSLESVSHELGDLIREKEAAGDYRFKQQEDRQFAQKEAERFFAAFCRKIISLSDGRCVYFAPDERSRERNGCNLSRCWAEYAFHAVSSSGKMLKDKNYRERLYNPLKARDVVCLENILKAEQCMYRLIDAHPENDAVVFMGFDAELSRLEIVTRLDQFGNAQANLSEVTVIVKHSRSKEYPPPKYRPLTEVVEAVAKHQAAGFSPSTTADTIANPDEGRKGAKGEEVGADIGVWRKINDSLFEQMEWLEKRLEYHLLANHLLANAKALVFAGAYLKNEKWLKKGMEIYRKELPEQVLVDGVHFERSAMYHSIILEDVLDCYELMRSRLEVEGETEDDAELFKKYAEKMLMGLKLLVGPDGKISKFNDSTDGIAKAPAELLAHAKELKIEDHHCTPTPSTYDSLRASGFVRMEKGAYCVIAKCGEIGPSYQPGHAHADTFTFELWKNGKKVIGDTGCSTYVPGAVRSYERSTAAHNTVVVDDRDSSEVWAAHRVGRRVKKVKVKGEGEERWGSYLDYSGFVLKRRLKLTDDGLKGFDEILGCGEHKVQVRFHLPPGVSEDEVKIMCYGDRCVEHCDFAVGWNKRETGRCIIYQLKANLPITFTWSIS